MPSILTVDDSRAIRALVSKNAETLGLTVDEAENGQEGLAKLAEMKFDLVVLDITMPLMDGPEMLKQMREAGNKTPVLMLTSEAKKSIIAEVMALGISDYIMKPFEPHELLAKIQRTLQIPGAAAAAAVPVAPPPPTPSSGEELAQKQFVDVLVIDDMENVQKRLRQFLPPSMTMSGATSANAGITLCRDRVFRICFIDTDIPDVSTSTLLAQLRLLQPSAACIALALRTAGDQRAFKSAGFDDVLHKPFDAASLEDITARYFDKSEPITTDGNAVRVRKFTGKPERLPGYFDKVATGAAQGIEKIAAACFEYAVIDLSQLPSEPDVFGPTVARIAESATSFGIGVRVVTTEEGQKKLKELLETNTVPTFSSFDAACAAP